MIDRAEILAVATDLSLTAEVVEKDFVLGWLLAAIYANEELATAWAFKGGTCLKKCYFETYRFSEDLDFTITDEAQLDDAFLRPAFANVSAWLYDETGIELPADQMRFEVYRNPRGGRSCEGRLYYRGPLQRAGSLPRIKLDLTADELLVQAPVERQVGHFYSDIPEGGIHARCYSYEEIFAEKVRALGERARPRDLYDVINLFRYGEFRPAAAVVLDILQQKCAFKRIGIPTLVSLAGALEELSADWQAMLGHQLPQLPPFEAYWSVLSEFFEWLEGAVAPPVPVPAPVAAGEEVYRPAVGVLRRQGVPSSSSLESIRFAASNRLCVDLGYQGRQRRIEPYSLRRTQAGDLLLYAVRADSGAPRSYRLDRIESVRVTDQSFSPRFAIELTPTEFGAISPAVRAAVVPKRGFSSARPPRRPRVRRPKSGPTYVYQCGACGKKFRRTKHNPRLGPHKAPDDWPCSGRTGYLIDTQY